MTRPANGACTEGEHQDTPVAEVPLSLPHTDYMRRCEAVWLIHQLNEAGGNRETVAATMGLSLDQINRRLRDLRINMRKVYYAQG